VQVDYYGAMTPLKTIAGISTPDSRSLMIQPYDQSAMQAIEKAIMKSDLGITPNSDGKVIRINIPQLTAVRLHCIWEGLHLLQRHYVLEGATQKHRSGGVGSWSVRYHSSGRLDACSPCHQGFDIQPSTLT